jgi:hypothetical protein
VVVQHIELCTTPLVLSSQTPNVAKTIPLEDVDVVGGIVGSAVDGVTQIAMALERTLILLAMPVSLRD